MDLDAVKKQFFRGRGVRERKERKGKTFVKFYSGSSLIDNSNNS